MQQQRRMIILQSAVFQNISNFNHILDLQQIRMLLLQWALFQNISYFAGGIATNLCTIHHQQFQHGHVFVSQSIEFWKCKFCAKKYSLSKISNFISKCHMLVLQLAQFRREIRIMHISFAQYFKLSVLYWTPYRKTKLWAKQSSLDDILKKPWSHVGFSINSIP